MCPFHCVRPMGSAGADTLTPLRKWVTLYGYTNAPPQKRGKQQDLKYVRSQGLNPGDQTNP